MALLLDSASLADARRAQELGFIEGITTNPALIAATGQPAFEVLDALTDILDGHVFYQVTAPTLEERIDEAWRAYDVRPDRIVIQIPATTENFSMISKLSGVDIAITAVFSPAQAYLAAEAKAHYLVPHVSRITHLLGDGVGLVSRIVEDIRGKETQIVAAGLTTIDESLAALRAGAHHLTLPLHLIEAMGSHEFSMQVIEEFTSYHQSPTSQKETE